MRVKARALRVVDGEGDKGFFARVYVPKVCATADAQALVLASVPGCGGLTSMRWRQRRRANGTLEPLAATGMGAEIGMGGAEVETAPATPSRATVLRRPASAV